MCTVGIVLGRGSFEYSFPGHPMNRSRIDAFQQAVERAGLDHHDAVRIIEPVQADEETLLLFHTKEYVEFVKKASNFNFGYLDYGDTPAFKGVFEASKYSVGATLLALDMVMKGNVDHAFNPVGGYHHARKDRAAGFCVFNDIAIAILHTRRSHNVSRVLYVDIDAHHGDGVCYGFYDDPSVHIADIHEDGRYLYPGTGFEDETGAGEAEGTKLNIPLPQGAGDEEFKGVLQRVEEFAHQARPELIILQCGADGLEGDPLTHLRYSPQAHQHATDRLHKIAHEYCGGRMMALGGGGYNPQNVAQAWLEVVKALLS